MWNRIYLWSPAVLLAGVVFLACGTESSGPAIGSAEWYWEAAQHNYSMGDYEKAQQHLEKLAETYADWKDQALPWRAALVGGLAHGYLELTDTFGLCASMNPEAGANLRNPIQEWRRDARRHALNFADTVAALQPTLAGGETLALDFAFPAGRPAKSPLMENVESGMTPRADQVASCEDEALGRGVVLQASMLAGAGQDVAQAQKLFEARPVEVPADTMRCALSESLVELSTIFDSRHVNETDKQAYMLELAVKTLQAPLSSNDPEIRKKAEEIKKKAEDIRSKAVS
jgi:hypothetical protein